MLTAFEFRKGTEIANAKVETIDALDGLFCYTDAKGTVYVNQLEISDEEFYAQDVNKNKVAKQKIDQIQILKLTKLIIALTAGKVIILNPATLEEKDVLVKASANSFAINANDYIAISIGKKVAFFFFDLQKVKFTPHTIGKTNEILLQEPTNKMIWNGDTLGIVSKKNYLIFDLKTVKLRELCPLNGTLYPCLLVSRGNWVAVTGESVMMFDSSGKVMPNGSLDIQATTKASPISRLAVVDYYLVALRETGAIIYNLLDFTKIQEVPFEKGWTYKDHAIDSLNLFIVHDMPVGPKREPTSFLNYLKGIPYEEQIKRLLKKANVQDAFKVFQQNTPKTDASYDLKKEHFNLEAAWALFVSLAFSQAIEFFLQVNYDPRELLALLPGLLKTEKHRKSLQDLIEERNPDIIRLDSALKDAQAALSGLPSDAPADKREAAELEVTKREKALKDAKVIFSPKVEQAVIQGKKSIMRLVEEKRKYLEGKFDLNADGKKTVTFLEIETPVNDLELPKSLTVDETMELLDTSLLKMYVEEKEVNQMYSFINRVAVLKCNEKEMDAFLEERKDEDRSFTTQACQALLDDRFGNYVNALKIWKTLGQETREVRDMACKETARILKTRVEDKKIIITYARMVLVVNPEEGLKIFTENEGVTKIISEDDILAYLEGLEMYQPQLREQYLDYLINRKDSREHFYTLFALLYVSRIRAGVKDGKDLSNPEQAQNRKILMNFIKEHSKYNPQSILDEVQGLGLFEEEIFLYSKQKQYANAIDSLVKMGSSQINFIQAEEFCEENQEPLLAILFEKIVGLYTEAKEKLAAKGGDNSALKRRVELLEDYCKSFLKRYAGDEKMNAEAAINAIPDDWTLVDNNNGIEDDSLLQYLTLTFDDRQGKDINTKIAKKAREMQKLDVEGTLVKLQRAYVVINSENICKVCRKKLASGRSFYVYPNGVVTHSTCAKDIKVCPVTRINFAKKIYV